MESTGKHPSLESLRRFSILDDLADDQLNLLARALIIKMAPKGKKVLEMGDNENFSFFLLEGEVVLQAADGGTRKINHESEAATKPIAQLIPRLYDVIASTPIEFIQIDNQLLSGLSSSNDSPDSYEETYLSYGIENAAAELEQRLASDLANERLRLPSLPDVAVRIGRALEDEATDAKRIAKIVQTDMVITAKLIKVANSAFYASHEPVDTCTAAVVRLGINTTHKLVLSFALRELFRSSSGLLTHHMNDLWKHSRQVAAVCYVLAKVTRQFNPEHAMLAGLLHDIGEVAILSYAEDYPEIANNQAQLDHVIADLRGPVGSMILKSWEFTEDLVTVTEEAENWQRDPGDKADYSDLVIISQLHCFIGTPKMHDVPMLDQVPAFKKLELGELTPKMSLKILDKATKMLAQAESMLQS